MCVKKSTNLAALYGELGRVPLFVMRKIYMIKYWIKLITVPDSSLIKIVYNALKSDADRNINYNGNNLASHMKVILEDHELGSI